ncbi:hypothetical protein JCM5353_007317 [Sporobolomyces roseus]
MSDQPRRRDQFRAGARRFGQGALTWLDRSYDRMYPPGQLTQAPSGRWIDAAAPPAYDHQETGVMTESDEQQFNRLLSQYHGVAARHRELQRQEGLLADGDHRLTALNAEFDQLEGHASDLKAQMQRLDPERYSQSFPSR